MSLNELKLDLPKPWLSARVNDLVVDVDLNVSNSITSVGGISSSGTVSGDSLIGNVGVSKLLGGTEIGTSGDVIDKYQIINSTISTIGGTFVNTAFPISLTASRLGNRVSMRIPAFSVLFGNQNASGTIELLVSMPTDFQPLANSTWGFFLTNTGGVYRFVSLVYIKSTNLFFFLDGHVSSTFTKNTDTVSSDSDQFISWVI